MKPEMAILFLQSVKFLGDIYPKKMLTEPLMLIRPSQQKVGLRSHI